MQEDISRQAPPKIDGEEPRYAMHLILPRSPLQICMQTTEKTVLRGGRQLLRGSI